MSQSITRCPSLAAGAVIAMLGLTNTPWPVGAAEPQTAPDTVTGVVSDTLGGRVNGASITAVPDSGASFTTTTNAEGEYTLQLLPGRWTLRASSAGFDLAERTVTIAPGGPRREDLVLSVAGVVTSAVVVGRDYRVTSTPTATKTDTPLIRVPQSVQVVTSQIIADQRPLILSDALKNVSGISSLRQSAEVFRTFNVRGFTTLDLSVDGLRNTYGLNDQPDGVAHIERIDVAKGPSAALYGRGSLGGTVNLITKSPERARRASLSFSTGSGGLVQPTIDVTGPLSSTGSVRARAVVDYENRDTPIDFVSVERLQIAPSVQIDLGPQTVLDLRTDFRRREGIRFVALPAYGTVIGTNDLRVPFNLFIGEPGAGATENRGWQTTARLDRRIGSSWSATAALRWTANTFDMPSVGPRALSADNRTLTRRYTRFDETEQEVALDGWVTGRLTTGRIAHAIVIGADWSRFEYDSQFFSGGIGALDISRPVYGLPITGVFLLDHTLDRIAGGGLYLQNQMGVGSRLDVLLGVRYDRIEKTREFIVESRTATRDDDAVSPKVGASFQVASGVALFGSYSEGLVGVADGTANQTGRPFLAQQGHQWEGGLKLDLANSVSLTAAIFDLTRTGVLVTDPANPSFQLQTGEQASRGVELDWAWQSPRGLSAIATYSFTDAEVTRDTTIRVGNTLMNVPRHAGRVWGKYAWTPSTSGTFAVAAGITAQGEQQANITNTFTVPGSWVADLGLFWEKGRVGAQLNVVNLFDKEYALRGAFGNTGVIPGDTRRIVLTLKTRL